MKTGHFRLKSKLNEVFFIKPNDLGNKTLTRFFKSSTSFLKTMPFIIVVPLSFFSAFILYVIFGKLIVKVVSLLQYGF